ncbi:DUF3592 domain-containing protein [Streptomyces sp. FH025]|uniref:DUF3592 domain-containing protein n=1 Tax=Streptomyces sp. FH025 TaxID=2815937 RepID=UPI001FAFFB02|nr:DUF3592 domain-containing protein [Streptomyces sp. FH025]
MEEAFTKPMPVVLGIDDLRPLPRATRIARTSREGIRLLEEHRDRFIDELWLDHDLGGDDTIMPVVALMEEAAFDGRPFQIGAVFVHSANPVGAASVVRSLTRWSYRVQRASVQGVRSQRTVTGRNSRPRRPSDAPLRGDDYRFVNDQRVRWSSRTHTGSHTVGPAPAGPVQQWDDSYAPGQCPVGAGSSTNSGISRSVLSW